MAVCPGGTTDGYTSFSACSNDVSSRSARHAASGVRGTDSVTARGVMRTPAIVCTSMSCCQAARPCSKGSWACITNQPSGGITVLTESSSVTTSTLAQFTAVGQAPLHHSQRLWVQRSFGFFFTPVLSTINVSRARPGVRCLHPPECRRRSFVLSNGACRFQARWSICFWSQTSQTSRKYCSGQVSLLNGPSDSTVSS